MKYNTKTAYTYAKAFFLFTDNDLTIGQKHVFLLAMALYTENGSLTLYELKEGNLPANKETTASNFRCLKAKGYFTTQRTNQYFSRAFITPTDKAFLLLRSFRSLVVSLG